MCHDGLSDSIVRAVTQIIEGPAALAPKEPSQPRADAAHS